MKHRLHTALFGLSFQKQLSPGTAAARLLTKAGRQTLAQHTGFNRQAKLFQSLCLSSKTIPLKENEGNIDTEECQSTQTDITESSKDNFS